MRPCFAYVRVSTVRQGEGVSLQEALARTPTAYRYARERTDRFRAFVSHPDQVFDRAQALLRRELLKLLLAGKLEKKELAEALAVPECAQIRSCLKNLWARIDARGIRPEAFALPGSEAAVGDGPMPIAA